MTSTRVVKIPAEIIDTAAAWFIEMREPDVALAERERFSEWLRASPAHVQAYLEIAGTWSDAAQISEALDAEVDAAETNVVHLLAAARGDSREERIDEITGHEVSGVPSVAARGPMGGVRRRAAAAVVILAVGVTAAWWQMSRAPVYEAGVGEQRMVTLEDGSIVRLNSRSKLSVNLTPERRNVELLAGQALFEVAKDPMRPFVVRSGEVAIRAVGTAFDVYRKQTGTVITVVEGKVEVSSKHEEGRALSAGEQATVTSARGIERKKSANVAAATSWLQQELVFTGESLSAVVDEFNRYNKRTIVLADPSLLDLRVNAVFHSTNPDALLKFVSRYDGIEVTETKTEIRIAHREPEGK